MNLPAAIESLEEALNIAREIWFQTPRDLTGMTLAEGGAEADSGPGKEAPRGAA